MIRFTIDGFNKLHKAAAKTILWKELFHQKIGKEVKFFGIAVVGRSKKQYLSGRPGLNVISGDLRRSIVSLVRDTGKGFEMDVGTNVVYAKQHEFGDARRHIPQRAFLAPAVADEMQGLEDHLVEILTAFTGDPLGE